jgi:hypothetical protein
VLGEIRSLRLDVPLEGLTLLRRDVDTELQHRSDRQRSNVCSLSSCGEGLEAFSAELKQRFRHLAAMNGGTDDCAITANVSDKVRANVSAGFAKLVEEVKK